MGYFAAMAMLAPTVALLAASLSGNAATGATASPAVREGASSMVTVSARIVRASARVGPGFGPPAPRMVPRRATVSAADGRPVAALVYDFE